MSAVRLDPFARIVGVSWPSAAGPFRVLHQVQVNGIGATFAYSYAVAVHIRGNVSSLYFNTDRLRLTVGGVPFENPGAPSIFYSTATTFGVAPQPVFSTPDGWTVIAVATPQAFTNTFHDAAPSLLEVMRAGVPVLSVPLGTWSLYTEQSAQYPLLPPPSSFKNFIPYTT